MLGTAGYATMLSIMFIRILCVYMSACTRKKSKKEKEFRGMKRTSSHVTVVFFYHVCHALLLPWTKKRTMLLIHKIRILWYRGIKVLDSAVEPSVNATCDCRDFTHWCIAAKSDCRFFDITWCVTRMVLFFLARVVQFHTRLRLHGSMLISATWNVLD